MIITIARQAGSGGEEIGQLVAKRLNLAYFDREILLQAAQAGVVSQEALFGDDERPPSLADRIASLFNRTPTAGMEYPLPEDLPVVETEYEGHRHLVEEAIRLIAKTDGAVIVGRGGQVILRGQPHVFHVFIYAPDACRLRRLAEQAGIVPEEAASRIRETDRKRAGYIKAGYGVDRRDPDLYDLLINTARIDQDAAVDLVVRAAQSLMTQTAVAG